MNSNGTGAFQLTSDASEQKNPAWAPDGKRIVYVSNEGGDYNIWVMSLGNTGSQIEYTPSEDIDVNDDPNDSAIEKILKDNSIFVIASVIIVSILLVVIIVKLFIRSL